MLMNSIPRFFALLGVAWFVEAAAAQCATTPPQTEGPYYRAGSPYRASLRRAGDTTNLLALSGQVLDTNCQPIAHSWLDFWHADAAGGYDNSSPEYRYRGHLFTDANGQFTLLTIMPGLYPGRTRHIHVKVDAANTPLLTTQLYFPNEPRNATDPLYNPALEMDLTQDGNGVYQGSFVFVLTANQSCTAPTITGQSGNVTTSAGGTALFTITHTGSTPLDLRWRRNGVPLEDGGRISGANTAALTITGVTNADAGLYDCVAANACGTDTSDAARLILITPGDTNCDGVVDFFDIDSFLLALLDPAGYAAAYPACDRDSAEINGDGALDFFDLDPFINCVLNNGCP